MSEDKESMPEAKQTDDKREIELMEIEVFRQHWRSLNAALAEIKELRGADSPEIDPVEFVKHEVANLKNQFSELKELIVSMQQNHPAQNTPPRFQQMQPSVPILPYYQTPSFAPIVPINQQ